MTELSDAEKERLLEAIRAQQPPTIGVVGLSGSGKSSTINALFKTDLPVSHVAACTKDFWTVPLEVAATNGDLKGRNLRLHVIDAPGLGEDKIRDPGYLAMYAQHLPTCDVILWILSARNRALAQDQVYLEVLSDFLPKIVFGISQVDLVAPNNWQAGSLIPTREQRANIQKIVDDRANTLSRFVGRKVMLIPFSSERGYNLAELFVALLKAAPTGRKWLFQPLLNYDLDAWIARSPLRSSRIRQDEANQAEESGTFLGIRSALRQIFGLGKPQQAEAKMSELLKQPIGDAAKLSEEELKRAAAALGERRENGN